jgi:hypothetical protein
MTIRVRVQPRSKNNSLGERIENEWKLHVMAPALEGKANRACIDFLANGLRIAKSRVRLVSGEKSRHKVIALDGIEEAEFLRFASAGK